MNKRVNVYILLLWVTIIWGAALPIIKFTLGGFDPLTLLTYRFAISASIALPFLLTSGLKFPHNKVITSSVIGYGLLTSSIGLGLLFWGFERTTTVDASLIAATGPILIAVAGALFLNEHTTRRKRIGFALAFAGTVITLVEPILRNGDGLIGLGGNLLVFASVLIGVATAVWAKILLRQQINPAILVHVSFIVGFLTFAPILLILKAPATIVEEMKTIPLPYHLGVWYLAIFSGNIAYTLWHKAQKRIGIGEVGLFTYLHPIFAIPLAVLWLKETISIPFLIGAGIVATGVLIAEYRKGVFRSTSTAQTEIAKAQEI